MRTRKWHFGFIRAFFQAVCFLKKACMRLICRFLVCIIHYNCVLLTPNFIKNELSLTLSKHHVHGLRKWSSRRVVVAYYMYMCTHTKILPSLKLKEDQSSACGTGTACRSMRKSDPQLYSTRETHFISARAHVIKHCSTFSLTLGLHVHVYIHVHVNAAHTI